MVVVPPNTAGVSPTVEVLALTSKKVAGAIGKDFPSPGAGNEPEGFEGKPPGMAFLGVIPCQATGLPFSFPQIAALV